MPQRNAAGRAQKSPTGKGGSTGGGGGQAAANSAAQKKAKKKGGGGGVLKPVEIIDPQPVNIFTPATIIKQKKKVASPPKPAQAKTGNTVLTSTFNSAGKQLLGQ